MQRAPTLRTAFARSLVPSASCGARPLVTALVPTRAPLHLARNHWHVVTRGLATPPTALAPRSAATPGTAPSSSSSKSHSQSSNSDNSSTDTDETAKVPLTQRIKYLFRKHGWTALVVYLVLSAADFAACFLVISAIGADRVRDAEDWVLSHLGWRRAVDGFRERRAAHAAQHPHGADAHPSPAAAQAVSEGGHSTGEVQALERKGRSAASTYATTAVLAYAVHKTLLLPFRVGVTVAVTPRVVRTLQSWGWKVGMAAGAPPTAKAAASAAGKAAAH
ncbi:hypothetical protein DMC30DRAFT_419430 [Rhodotorula diobovata]|uniref:DUF1279 domain-containing protein n=1 Tax=Rhodotorula diobovata TaxID=5288 RepID=A0A5C5FM88_9BASI|nr:hypothetical protein DMC30DRAFT_419430 [Rhodotorula diobovata]